MLYHFQQKTSAEFYKEVLWTTSGDGLIQNSKSLNLAYLRGPEDLSNGSVELTCMVIGYLQGQEASDAMILYIDSLPMSFAGNDTTICSNHSIQLHGVAENYSEINWYSGGSGDFDDPSAINAVYTPGLTDTTTGSVELYLQAISAHCEDTATSSFILTFDPCFGVNELSGTKHEISIFPNPNNGIFELLINGDSGSESEISILSVEGKILFTQKIDPFIKQFSKSFDLHLLKKGTYYIRIHGQEYIKTIPVLIN